MSLLFAVLNTSETFWFVQNIKNLESLYRYLARLALKSLEPSHGVLQLLKKNFYSVLILHLLKSLFSVFRGFQALCIFFVLVNDLYIGDPLEANKTQEICIFQQDSAHEHTE